MLEQIDASQQPKDEEGTKLPRPKTKQWVYFSKEETRTSASISCAQTRECIRTVRPSVTHTHKISAFLTNVPGARSGLLILLGCRETRAKGVHTATSHWHSDASLRYLLHMRWGPHLVLRHHWGSHAIFGKWLQRSRWSQLRLVVECHDVRLTIATSRLCV